MPRLWHESELAYRGIRTGAFVAFAGYLVWNVSALLKGEIPASLFKALTGFPCPTTGCCRGLVALLQGDWNKAFLWNPMLPVYLGLTAYSLWVLIRKRRPGTQASLSPMAARMWAAALAAGWIAKFLIGPSYW